MVWEDPLDADSRGRTTVLELFIYLFSSPAVFQFPLPPTCYIFLTSVFRFLISGIYTLLEIINGNTDEVG